MDGNDHPRSDSGATRRLRVLIADDHAPFRAGVRDALEARGFEVVADAADAQTAIDGALRERPDICLIDLDMPGSGLSAIAPIVKRVPQTLVIVLTVSDRTGDLRTAIAHGASGYLLKGMSGTELATVLGAAYRGKSAVSTAVIPQLVAELRRVSGRRLVLPTGAISLTDREWEVAELLRDGLPSKAIAVQLGLSPITARKHVASLVKKLGARDRKTAVQTLQAFKR